MPSLPPNHFLSLAQAQVPSFLLPGSSPSSSSPPICDNNSIDTSTLAAHDFDVDARTGFLPPQPPLARLPAAWEAWELALEDAIARNLKLGSKPELTEVEAEDSASWRAAIRQMPVISTSDIKGERTLRRAHHVLAWLMHFYIHTLPPTSPILIPSSISTPLLSICSVLRLPPVLTYSDDVLYNWSLAPGHTHPTPSNLRIQTTFTGTKDEDEFYLASARIELHGVPVLALLSTISDELFVSDALAIHRITSALRSLAPSIEVLTSTLLAVREGCDPAVFYNEIRPWFKGQDSSPDAQRWEFEDADPENEWMKELSGPSAGQSSLIHALDIFLGVAEHTHADGVTGKEKGKEHNPKHGSKPFLERMQLYMPRHHRAFLKHLAESPTPLRALIEERTAEGMNSELLESYNQVVAALKRFRDAHMRVVVMYIVGPARRAEREEKEEKEEKEGAEAIKGTGGTELVKFLKEVRDRTAGAVLS